MDTNFCSPKCRQYWFYFKDSKVNAKPTFKHRKSLENGIKIRKNYSLTNIQKQVVLGSMLGDGHLTKRKSGKCRLALGHTSPQKEYLLWKMELMSPLFLAKPNKRIGKPNNLYHSCTIVHDYFSSIYSSFYRKKKGKNTPIIKRKDLNKIEPMGLLIWYLDDGSFSNDNIIKFATHSYTLSENKAIKIWLWQKYRIKATIHNEKSLSNTMYYLMLDVGNSKKFLNIISIYKDNIPKCMMYKIVKERLTC